jgi:two-component system cell cycle sensor histidine kinase/response regulator CckA
MKASKNGVVRQGPPQNNSDNLPKEITPAAVEWFCAQNIFSGRSPDESEAHDGIDSDLNQIAKRFQTVFKAAPLGIAIANPKGYFLEVNNAFIRMLGYRKNEIKKMTFVDITHPEDRKRSIRLSHSVRQGKFNSYQTEKRYLRKNGEVIWAILKATAIKDDDGNIQYWLAIIEDLTERKHAEKALEESEKRYRLLFELAAEGILVVDVRTGKFMYANPAICKMLGYTEAELINMRVKDIHKKEDLTRVVANFTKMSPGEKRLVQNIPCVCRDGSKIYVNINSTRVVIDGRKSILGFFQDITQRVKTEAALREKEEKYRNILANIEEGYFEVDLAGSLTFANDATCKIMGYPHAELIGMNNRQYTKPEDAKRMYQVFNHVYRTGQPAKVTDHEVIAKNGTKKYLEMSANLMQDADQKPVGFRGVVRDVTDRIRAEKEKERLASQIQHAQKMEAIGTLAGGIAHDFNNLLMGFQGNISLMLLDIDADHPHWEYLRTMESYVLKGSELTRQILGFARRGKYQVKPTNLNDLINKSADMFSRTKKEITIHKKFSENLFPVEVDRGQMEQILLNLFVNAWQAMPGGGHLYLETENVDLGEDYDKPYEIKPGKYARIAITDTGTGMPPRVQERIFEPFFTTKGIGRGTGLGLASAYGIIKNHNGIINVYSEEGHGTTFKIYLPASKKQVVAEKPAFEAVLKGRETILLVDDEEMIIDIGKEMFESLGYTIITAKGGAQALTLFEKYADRIDLVVLDMIMPDISGSETFDHLKAIKPEVKVLLSSGYSIDGRATEILNRGCKGFIQKPFNLKQISRKIREILDS